MRPHHLLPLLWLLAGTSCSTTPVAARTSATPLTFGAVPAGERGTREAELAPLVEHLARVLNRPVQLEVPASYRAMAQGMAEARWELAYVGPILYSRAHETSYDAVAVPVRDGKTTVEGVLLARRDRGLSELAALKGKRIAFVDPSSSAGFQYPFALLYANGLPPGSYERRFVGSHAAVLRAVLSGELDAGATYRAAPQEYLTPEQAAELVVIGTTDPVASDVFAVRRGSPDAERIRDALLSVGGAPDARRILAPMNAQSLAPADERAFDSARKIDLLVSEQDEP